MTTSDLEILTERLRLAEQQIAIARTEIVALRARHQPSAGARSVAGLLAVVAAVAAGAAWSATTEAQSAATPSTVKAPFVVVDAAGRPIMKVDDADDVGMKGVRIFGAQGQVAANLTADSGGNGYVGVRGAADNGLAVLFVESGSPIFRMQKVSGKNFVEINAESATLRTAAFRLASLEDKAFVEMKKTGSTLHAPFIVLDGGDQEIARTQEGSARGLIVTNANRKAIASVLADEDGNGVLIARDGKSGYGSGIRFDDGEPVLALKSSDNKLYVHLQRVGSNLLGPLTINDTAGKPVMIVSDSVTAEVKDENGQSKAVTTNRGAHILNGKGQTVARAAADNEGNGYMLARDSSGKGATAGMIVTSGGSQLLLAGSDGKTRTAAKSTEGFVVYNAKGIAVGSLGSASSKGYFELSDAEGNKMVESSSQPDGKGYVLVTPWQVSVAALGDPSVLRGGKKK